MVLSMNGVHAFPDKGKAFQETWRVLKKDGTFIACFYIKGKSRITDWLVKNILSKRGWFTPPFHTENELKVILEKLYRNIDIHVDGSIVYFVGDSVYEIINIWCRCNRLLVCSLI